MRTLQNRIADVDVQRAIDATHEAARRSLTTDRTSATYHSVTVPTSGSVTIAHRRGHPVRWVVVRQRAAGAVYEAGNGVDTLQLTASATSALEVEIMLW